jgi:murein DD-endopeptidase MepM/ murein hydrolase activator NlpD
MLFGASHAWWDDRDARPIPHEGLDLCLYRDLRGRVQGLEPGCQIPVLYDGVVVAVIDDYIGRSVIVRHSVSEFGTRDVDVRAACTMYGHTVPAPGLRAGATVRQGEVIAHVASVHKPGSDLRPHLHLSIGLVSRPIAYEALDWGAIGDPGTMRLIDPLPFIGRACLVEDG